MIAYVEKRMEMKILNEVEMNVSGAALCQMDAWCYYAVLIDRRSHLIHYV